MLSCSAVGHNWGVVYSHTALYPQSETFTVCPIATPLFSTINGEQIYNTSHIMHASILQKKD